METTIGLAQRKSVTDEGATSTVTTLCLDTSEWTDIAALTVPQGGDAGAYATFQRPSVCGGSALTLSPPSRRSRWTAPTMLCSRRAARPGRRPRPRWPSSAPSGVRPRPLPRGRGSWRRTTRRGRTGSSSSWTTSVPRTSRSSSAWTAGRSPSRKGAGDGHRYTHRRLVRRGAGRKGSHMG